MWRNTASGCSGTKVRRRIGPPGPSIVRSTAAISEDDLAADASRPLGRDALLDGRGRGPRVRPSRHGRQRGRRRPLRGAAVGALRTRRGSARRRCRTGRAGRPGARRRGCSRSGDTFTSCALEVGDGASRSSTRIAKWSDSGGLVGLHQVHLLAASVEPVARAEIGSRQLRHAEHVPVEARARLRRRRRRWRRGGFPQASWRSRLGQYSCRPHRYDTLGRSGDTWARSTAR